MLINKSFILLLDSKLNKFNQTINMSNSIADLKLLKNLLQKV